MMMATRVGVLAASGTSHIEAIRCGLTDQRLAEGVAVELTCRVANGDISKLPALVSEIITTKPEIIIAIGAVTAQAVRQASAELPMIYAMVIDPVADGFATSSGSPLHNSTGITTFDPDQATTHVRLLRELRPKIRRVAILADEGVSTCLANANSCAFQSQGVETQTIGIAGPNPNLAEALARVAYFYPNALVVLEHPTNGAWRTSIARRAKSLALPTIFARDHANDDGLVAYGTSLLTAVRQVPRFLKKVLEGASPITIPIEIFRCPELLLNQKAATSLGIKLPAMLLDGTL